MKTKFLGCIFYIKKRWDNTLIFKKDFKIDKIINYERCEIIDIIDYKPHQFIIFEFSDGNNEYKTLLSTQQFDAFIKSLDSPESEIVIPEYSKDDISVLLRNKHEVSILYIFDDADPHNYEIYYACANNQRLAMMFSNCQIKRPINNPEIANKISFINRKLRGIITPLHP